MHAQKHTILVCIANMNQFILFWLSQCNSVPLNMPVVVSTILYCQLFYLCNQAAGLYCSHLHASNMSAFRVDTFLIQNCGICFCQQITFEYCSILSIQASYIFCIAQLYRIQPKYIFVLLHLPLQTKDIFVLRYSLHFCFAQINSYYIS